MSRGVVSREFRWGVIASQAMKGLQHGSWTIRHTRAFGFQQGADTPERLCRRARRGVAPVTTRQLGLAQGRGRGRVKAQAKAKAKTKPCYAGANCTPGKGRNTSGCDFTDSRAFFEGDFRGSNLSNNNFTGAVLARGDFRGANMSGSCLVGANLHEAKLGSSVNLGDAIFCQTLMPDGSLNNRDCDKGTRCCPTPGVCEGEACEGGTCVPPHNWCSIFGNPCCQGRVCTPTLSSPFLTTCQKHCETQSDCQDDPGTTCGGALGFEFCFYIGQCCA